MDAEVTSPRQLFERHHQAVYRFFLRLGTSLQEAEDLTQDVFLRALRLEHRRPVAHETAWLFRIARNLWIDTLRRKRRRAPVEAPAKPLRPDDENEPCSYPEGEVPPVAPDQPLRVDLDRALAQLKPEDRETFLLREVAGLSYEEISALGGGTPAAVRSRIFRARRALRAILATAPQPTTAAVVAKLSQEIP